MEIGMKRWQMFRLPGFLVSLKVPVAILLVLFGVIPMTLCTYMLMGSLRQSQTDSRMVEVQNQCQILSSKMTRAGYLRGDFGSSGSDFHNTWKDQRGQWNTDGFKAELER